jgi:LacI family transcriptional regulator
MGASRKAEELGYRLEEFWMKKPGLSPERSSEMLLERGIQGLVLGPQERHRGRIELDWPCFSAVAIGFSLEVPRLNVVSGETFYSMLICLRELATLGYHRIGLMIFDDHDDRVQNRFIGAYLAASENPPAYTLRLPILRTSAFTEKIFMDWFEQNHPDAVVGMTPLIPAYLERHGYSVPGDIGFASPFLAGDLSMYAHADDLPHEMGGLAMEMVSQMIDRNETGIPAMPRNLSVEPVWVPQHSVRRMGPSFPLQSA